jgi:2-polyprenyl-6-methoxyphenol hydroxylase-like FAD-dependent oxidoreductase/predicted ester cyclase
MLTRPHVVIVGGNIAGLATALGLHQVGVDVTVLERMPAHPAVPGGLHIASNGVRSAERLGVAEQLIALGSPVERFQYRAPDGALLLDAPTGEYARRAGTTTFFVRRKDVTRILAEALPSDIVRFGAKVSHVDDGPDGAIVRLADGEELHASVVLGADGLRSSVRAQLFGEVPLRYSGYQDWGAVVDIQDPIFPEGHFWTLWGEGLRFGLAHIGDGSVYWAASLDRPETRTDAPSVDELLERFGGWARPVPDLLKATRQEDIFGAPIVDFAPRRPWSRGRVALLGDAAHATTPSVGRGASEALEDGVTIANAIAAIRDVSDRDEVAEALAEWATSRFGQTAFVTRLSRHIGSVGLIKNTTAVHTYLRATAWSVRRQIRRDVSHEVPALRQRPRAWRAPVTAEDLTDPRELAVYRLMEECFHEGKEDYAYELVAPDVVTHFHTLPGGEAVGIEAFLSIPRNLRRGFPDLSFDIQNMYRSGDSVMTHDITSGTHLGHFQGLPPTGRRFAVDACHQFRFEDGKIVEGRVILDTMEVPQQLGALPKAMASFPAAVGWIAERNSVRRRRRLGLPPRP